MYLKIDLLLHAGDVKELDIYIYIVIHRQTASLYHKSSV